jgi:flavin-dependent dehydrogenase
MMSKMKILGAGPSGLSAAINLAKAGYKVDIFEKNRDVGGRFYGNLQGLENWSDKRDALEILKEMNIEINFDCNPFSELTFSNGSKIWDIKFNKLMFYLVKRGSIPGSLDQGLKEQALKLGVNIHFERTMPEEQADIIAIGPNPKEACGIDKGIVFKTKMKDVAICLIDNNAAFKGYSYLLVTNGYGCMCTVLFDKFEKINGCFVETKKIFSNLIDLDMQNPKTAGGIGCFSNRNIFQKENRLYVGEAAKLQDALWGFGIKIAITSGFLAAKSIINNENYEKLAKKYFRRKLNAGIVNRFIWEKLVINNPSFFLDRIYNSKNILNRLYSFYNFNIFQRLIYPYALKYIKKTYKKLKL